MAQFALPDTSIWDTVGAWNEAVGDGDGEWFEELDEGFGAGRGSGSGPDDATTYWDTVADQNGTFSTLSTLGTELSPVTDPVGNTGHIFRTRNRKHAANGQQIDIYSTFRETSSDTEIATQSEVDVDNVWTTRGATLTTGEADNITDYGTLRIGTFNKEVGGGQPRTTHESAHEFECPDAGGGSGRIMGGLPGIGGLVGKGGIAGIGGGIAG